MACDVLIRGGTVVTDEGPATADVAIADGRIAELGPGITVRADEEIDAAGCHLFPGLVDPHVHFNDPGRSEWEGIATGSEALAAGGGTLFVDMPLNASPPTLDAASFDAKLSAARGRSRTDFAFWGGIVPGNLDHLEDLAERGVVGFKAFMSSSGVVDFPAADDATLWRGMRVAAGLGLPVLVHAENDAIITALARAAVASGRTGVRDYLDSRPVIAECEAIGRAIALAGDAGCALHVVHVSSGAGVALVAEARARGCDVSCEACPHHLVLSDADAERLGAIAKAAPPLRPASDQARLWEAVRDGRIDFVASDHSPAPPALKRATNFFDVWGGIAGVQTTLGLLLEEGHARRGLPLDRLARLTATAAVERFRLGDRGRLAAGSSADIAVVDVAAVGPLATDMLRDRHRFSPYVGRTVRGRVLRTLLRGHTVWHDGRAVGPARGRFVAPGGRGSGPAGVGP